jgi:PhoPQ-activated pathogenicity-related protein
MLLYNTGGDPGTKSTVIGLYIAQKAAMPVAFLYNVPKQPLFGGKKEDALIAETFVRFLDSEDATWPLLFPMVKSVVRGMDAIQQFAAEEFKTDVKKFVITGASKRGWTSWLTAASGDKRVIAIAPMVIDTLNIPEQMKNQVRAFGKPSEMIRDYTLRKLVPIPPGDVAQALWKMVDPWSYRSKLTLPKMIINGANDPYWPLDAMNSYWDDLPGKKYVLYVPNAGHNLEEHRANGFKDRDRALGTLAAFTYHQVTGTPMPQLDWKHNGSRESVVLTMTSDKPMKTVRLWKATSDTRDFRKSVWTEQGVTSSGQEANVKLSPPATGFAAYFGEAEYEQGGRTFYLSTQIRILEAGE